MNYFSWISVHIEYQLLLIGVLILIFLFQVASAEKRGIRRKCLAVGFAITALGLIFFTPLRMMWKMEAFYPRVLRPPSAAAHMNCFVVSAYDKLGGTTRLTSCTFTLDPERQ